MGAESLQRSHARSTRNSSRTRFARVPRVPRVRSRCGLTSLANLAMSRFECAFLCLMLSSRLSLAARESWRSGFSSLRVSLIMAMEEQLTLAGSRGRCSGKGGGVP